MRLAKNLKLLDKEHRVIISPILWKIKDHDVRILIHRCLPCFPFYINLQKETEFFANQQVKFRKYKGFKAKSFVYQKMLKIKIDIDSERASYLELLKSKLSQRKDIDVDLTKFYAWVEKDVNANEIIRSYL